MTADTFVACFLGCLLALTCVAVAGYQIVAYVIRRAIRQHAELLRNFAPIASQVSSMPEVVVRCACGSQQSVPKEMDVMVFLQRDAGWECRATGWTCPVCVGKERAS